LWGLDLKRNFEEGADLSRLDAACSDMASAQEQPEYVSAGFLGGYDDVNSGG
jgi:hypothetical protein